MPVCGAVVNALLMEEKGCGRRKATRQMGQCRGHCPGLAVTHITHYQQHIHTKTKQGRALRLQCLGSRSVEGNVGGMAVVERMYMFEYQ